MNKFSGYDSVEVNDFGEREKLELGGHYCKILKVKIDTVTTKEQRKFDVLVLDIDICEPDAQAGFYQRRFAQDAQKDAMTAKWKGTYRVNVPDDNSTDEQKSRFKTFTTCIEKSNSGYVWNWEENTLVGKKFIGVFGLEEFTLPSDGRTITFTRCRFARSTEADITKISIPKVKLLDGSYVDYEDYKSNKVNGNDNNNKNTTNEFEGSSDDLPF